MPFRVAYIWLCHCACGKIANYAKNTKFGILLYCLAGKKFRMNAKRVGCMLVTTFIYLPYWITVLILLLLELPKINY